jgi:hypothetical protein
MRLYAELGQTDRDAIVIGDGGDFVSPGVIDSYQPMLA